MEPPKITITIQYRRSHRNRLHLSDLLRRLSRLQRQKEAALDALEYIATYVPENELAPVIMSDTARAAVENVKRTK